MKASTLISPEKCIGQSKLLNYQSIGALELLSICFKRFIWKFYGLIGTDDFFNLTAGEFYWILRNPCIVEPSGGVLAIDAIDRWVTHHCNLQSLSTGAATKSAEETAIETKAEKLRSMLIFGLIEGLEARVAADAPCYYKARGVLSTSVYEDWDKSRSSNNAAQKDEGIASSSSSSAAQTPSSDQPPVSVSPESLDEGVGSSSATDNVKGEDSSPGSLQTGEDNSQSSMSTEGGILTSASSDTCASSAPPSDRVPIPSSAPDSPMEVDQEDEQQEHEREGLKEEKTENTKELEEILKKLKKDGQETEEQEEAASSGDEQLVNLFQVR